MLWPTSLTVWDTEMGMPFTEREPEKAWHLLLKYHCHKPLGTPVIAMHWVLINKCMGGVKRTCLMGADYSNAVSKREWFVIKNNSKYANSI